MFSGFLGGKGVGVGAWAAGYDGKRSGRVRMERGPELKRAARGCSAKSDGAALEQGIHREGMMLQRDGALLRTARKAVVRGSQNPAVEVAADLNPIEYMWWHLKRGVYDVDPRFDQIGGPKAQRWGPTPGMGEDIRPHVGQDPGEHGTKDVGCFGR